MKKNSLLFFFLLVFLFSCTKKNNIKKLYILKSDEYYKEAGYKFFQPGKENVDKILNDIWEQVAEHHSEFHRASHIGLYYKEIMDEMYAEILEKKDTYIVQVLGIERDGKKQLYFNFFSERFVKELVDDGEVKNLKKEIFLVADGGTEFWEVWYDFDNKKIEYTSVNGYA